MDCFVGEIRLFPYNFAPQGWVFCNGASLAVGAYAVLHAVIGYQYGGSGQSFNIPDLRGKVVVGTGSGPGLTPRSLGQSGGSAGVSLTAQQVPTHTHGWRASRVAGDSSTPTGNLLGNIPGTVEFKSLSGVLDNPVPLSPAMVQPQGGNMPHPNQQPYLEMGFYISFTGDYPQRP